MNLLDKAKPFLECKYSDGNLIKVEDLKDALRDYTKFLNEGYILVEDRKYFEEKYNTKNWHDDEVALNNIFGDFLLSKN